MLTLSFAAILFAACTLDKATVKQQACCGRFVDRLEQDSLLWTIEDNFGTFQKGH